MNDDLFPGWRDTIDPIKMAQRDLKKALPKRFYTDVTAAPMSGGHGVLLDGKPIRTPGKRPFVVPSATLSQQLAQEWRAQTEWVEPTTMPMTRLVNSALDGVAQHMEATVAEVAKYAETDLICYRAGDPQALVEAQARAWDPMLAFAREALGARLICAEGVMYVAQPDSARAAVHHAVETIANEGPLRLAALSVMTSLSGSVILAFAVTHGALTTEAAWASAHVDEDYQMRVWGMDADALARRNGRWREMVAAAKVFALGAATPDSGLP